MLSFLQYNLFVAVELSSWCHKTCQNLFPISCNGIIKCHDNENRRVELSWVYWPNYKTDWQIDFTGGWHRLPAVHVSCVTTMLLISGSHVWLCRPALCTRAWHCELLVLSSVLRCPLWSQTLCICKPQLHFKRRVSWLSYCLCFSRSRTDS
jgi:hypothetical protein